MEKNIKITVANPAGNKTIFVHDKFERADYGRVRSRAGGLHFGCT